MKGEGDFSGENSGIYLARLSLETNLRKRQIDRQTD